MQQRLVRENLQLVTLSLQISEEEVSEAVPPAAYFLHHQAPGFRALHPGVRWFYGFPQGTAGVWDCDLTDD
jgi:hypothetical protein